MVKFIFGSFRFADGLTLLQFGTVLMIIFIACFAMKLPFEGLLLIFGLSLMVFSAEMLRLSHLSVREGCKELVEAQRRMIEELSK